MTTHVDMLVQTEETPSDPTPKWNPPGNEWPPREGTSDASRYKFLHRFSNPEWSTLPKLNEIRGEKNAGVIKMQYLL